jgi:hypothetical protein
MGFQRQGIIRLLMQRRSIKVYPELLQTACEAF